jgi:hypothetical protein
MTGIIPNGACVEGQTHCLNEIRARIGIAPIFFNRSVKKIFLNMLQLEA